MNKFRKSVHNDIELFGEGKWYTSADIPKIVRLQQLYRHNAYLKKQRILELKKYGFRR